MTDLPEALLALTPGQMLAAIEHMRTIVRTRRGAELRADAQAREDARPKRSAASYAGEFFSTLKSAEHPQGATAAPHAPDEAQLRAELERIRAGNVAALLAKDPPAAGAWAKTKLPRTGWSLLTVEDTGQLGGFLCEVCERGSHRFSYILHHAAWPPAPPADAGSNTYACRLCTAHLLGGAPPSAGAKRKKRASDEVRWIDGPNGHRVRNGELRPDFKDRRAT